VTVLEAERPMMTGDEPCRCGHREDEHDANGWCQSVTAEAGDWTMAFACQCERFRQPDSDQ